MSIIDHPSLRTLLTTKHEGSGAGRPLAVFDCDGTLVRGDVGESMLYMQIERFRFHVSPADVWPDYPDRKGLDRAYRELLATNGKDVAQHRSFDDFATRILSWYFGRIEERRIAKACADIVKLLAGFTLGEVRALAEESFQRELAAPPGKRALGGRALPRGIRWLKETGELLRSVQSAGFDILVVSGSNRWSVEPVAAHFEIPQERVIGIALENEDGVLSRTVRNPVPVMEGKVEVLRTVDGRAPLLVVSDSRNDRALFDYSEGVKLLVNSGADSSEKYFPRQTLALDPRWVILESPTMQS